MENRFYAIIKGKVQGVYFRAWTLDEAKKLGLKGFVRNLPDGSVELDAQGEETDLLRLISRCQHGPAHAKVEQVLLTYQDLGEFQDFNIR